MKLKNKILNPTDRPYILGNVTVTTYYFIWPNGFFWLILIAALLCVSAIFFHNRQCKVLLYITDMLAKYLFNTLFDSVF